MCWFGENNTQPLLCFDLEEYDVDGHLLVESYTKQASLSRIDNDKLGGGAIKMINCWRRKGIKD